MEGGQSPLLSSPQKTMTQNRKCIAVDVLYGFDTSLPHGFIQRFLGKNMKNKNPILFPTLILKEQKKPSFCINKEPV